MQQKLVAIIELEGLWILWDCLPKLGEGLFPLPNPCFDYEVQRYPPFNLLQQDNPSCVACVFDESFCDFVAHFSQHISMNESYVGGMVEKDSADGDNE